MISAHAITAADQEFDAPLPSSVPVSDADPFSVAFFDDPHSVQDALRELGPIVWLRRYRVYASSRYQEVHAILNDWERFCSSRGVGLTDFAKETPWRVPSLVLERDPPEHTRARSVLSRVLSPVTMKRLRESFAVQAEKMAAELAARGRFDAIRDLAEAYPLTVFPDALGLGKEGRENLLPFAAQSFNSFGPKNELWREAMRNGEPVRAWAWAQCQRENLSPDGFGAMINAAADRGEITHEEAPLLTRSLVSAGVDTTINGLGAAVYCLARFPNQWARLRADPSLARGAFEEAVRFESPVQTFFRTTTRPVSIGGVDIPEGQKVLMFLGGANRDPRRWAEPDRYDIGRVVSGHVGFGSGIHMCVGQLMARLEGELMLSALARHVVTIEIVGEPKRRYNNTLRGLASLPVAVTAA